MLRLQLTNSLLSRFKLAPQLPRLSLELLDLGRLLWKRGPGLVYLGAESGESALEPDFMVQNGKLAAQELALALDNTDLAIAPLTHLGARISGVYSASFSPDGKRVVTASADNTARIWNADSAKDVVVLQGHGGSVRSATFNRDGTRVLSTALDRTVRLWDAQSGQMVAFLKGHAAAFSGDGKRMVTADDETARIWEIESGKEIAVIKGVVRGPSFSPDGKRVGMIFPDDTARISDAERGNELAVLKGHSASVSTVMFSRDGRRIVTASDDTTARIDHSPEGPQRPRTERGA